jgi:hypothetical protein
MNTASDLKTLAISHLAFAITGQKRQFFLTVNGECLMADG